ncbi:MAG: YceI family protein [Hymenobacteraceae bacterium]|nr:YceI family protein [Hymenobacteraceae bacterium]
MLFPRFRLPVLLVSLLFAAGPVLAAPPTLRADKARSSITYTCVHTLHEWSGTSHNLDAVLVLDAARALPTKVAMVGKVADFDSGNSNRDSHALEVLDAIKYPTLSFVSTRITPVAGTLKVEGNLTFHGIMRPVVMVVTPQPTAHELAYTGQLLVNLSDYSIDRPTFMLVPMEDAMKLDLVMVFSR